MAINLKQKKGQTPIQENYNKSLTTYPSSFVGEGANQKIQANRKGKNRRIDKKDSEK